MTFHDASGEQRHDRLIIAYDFTDNAVTGINLTCNGHHPQVVIDLGANPLEIELVTGSVTAISALIDALTEARALLEHHQVEHATGDTWTQEPLYIPDDWNGQD